MATLSPFGSAFAAARKEGKRSFDFNGKSYHTLTREEVDGGMKPGRDLPSTRRSGGGDPSSPDPAAPKDSSGGRLYGDRDMPVNEGPSSTGTTLDNTVTRGPDRPTEITRGDEGPDPSDLRKLRALGVKPAPVEESPFNPPDMDKPGRDAIVPTVSPLDVLGGGVASLGRAALRGIGSRLGISGARSSASTAVERSAMGDVMPRGTSVARQGSRPALERPTIDGVAEEVRTTAGAARRLRRSPLAISE